MPKPLFSGRVASVLSAVLSSLALAATAPESAPGPVTTTTETQAEAATDAAPPPAQTAAKLPQDLLSRLDVSSRVVDLGTGDSAFQALFVAAQGKQQHGALVLLSDRGQHPDWPGPLKTLRQGLPAHGWATLAIALPSATARPKAADTATPVSSPGSAPNNTAATNSANITAAPARPESNQAEEKNQIVSQTQARLTASLDYLKQQGYSNNVVLAVGDGAQLAALVLKNQSEGTARAFIALAPWSLLTDDQTEIAQSFTELPMAVLELLPGQWPEPRQQERKLLAEKKQHRQYTQLKLQDSALDLNHSQQLQPRIRGWLKRHVQKEVGKEAATAQPTDNKASSSANRSGVPTSSQPPK